MIKLGPRGCYIQYAVMKSDNIVLALTHLEVVAKAITSIDEQLFIREYEACDQVTLGFEFEATEYHS